MMVQLRSDNVKTTCRVSSARNNKTDYIFCLEVEESKNENENDVCAIIGGVKVSALVDSGSTYNLIDIDSWQRMEQNNIQLENMRHGSDRIFKASVEYFGHL